MTLDQQLALQDRARLAWPRVHRHLRRRDHRTVPALQLRRVRRPRHRPQLPAAARRAVRPPAPDRAGQGRGQAQRRQAGRAVPVHPQRRPLPDGARLLHPPRRRRRHRLVRRLRTRHRGQPGGDRRDGRTRHRHLQRVPEAVDRRDRPRRRRRDHHGLRRRLPDLPRQALRGVGPRRPGRPRGRRRAPDPRRHRTPRARAAGRARHRSRPVRSRSPTRRTA